MKDPQDLVRNLVVTSRDLGMHMMAVAMTTELGATTEGWDPERDHPLGHTQDRAATAT